MSLYHLRGFNSPHHQRPFDNVSTYGYHDMPIQNSYLFQEGGYQERSQVSGGRKGDLGGRGYYRPRKEKPRHEAWHEDNMYEEYGDNPNLGQAYHGGYDSNQQGDKGLHKTQWKPQAYTYKSWPQKEDTPKVAFKNQSKPKVEG
ncbi:hypothetical protein M9H77_31072 [Catharanthus roseus]|uniref:Uncharacterized protein n=1 Tax=Catharanthus roseus TaxID=4058 RepID=A0ACC0A0W2_CATRO|nr:hypothetical protein M9H77_31072 [Catharanthus roseus]